LGISLPAAGGVAFKIVAAFRESQTHGLEALNVVALTFFIFAGVVAGSFLVADAADWIRRGAVARARPQARLLFGRWTRMFAEGLTRAGLADPPRYLGSYVVTVEDGGLGLWRGVRRVREFAMIPWARIDSFQLGSDRDAQGVLQVVELDVNRDGPGTTITLAVSRSWWQGGVAPERDLLSIIEDLRERQAQRA
jgi:hypothetical protein